MITAVGKNNIQTKPLSFKGSTLVENLNVAPKGNVLPCVNHKTALFRDSDILFFAINHLKKIFSGGTIVHEACSTGEELYSTKMLADETGTKFKFIGYDIGPQAIEKAKQGIALNETDSIFINKNSAGDINKLGVKNKQLGFLSKLLKKNFVIDKEENICYPTADFKKGITFEVGNINNIETQKLPKDTIALFFKNAFYHVTGNHWSNPFLKKENISNPDNLKTFLQSGIDKITHIVKYAYKELPEKGLFVIGQSEPDHIFAVPFYSETKEEGCINLFEDKDIRGTINDLLKENNLKFPKKLKGKKEGFLDLILRREGFEPVKYSDMMQTIASKVYKESLKLPSVWMKK